MSCPRDVRPDYTAGKGYGDVHGTEEHPGISLLTGECSGLGCFSFFRPGYASAVVW